MSRENERDRKKKKEKKNKRERVKNRKLLVARKVMRPHVVQGQGQRQQRGVHTSEIPGPQLCCQFFRVGFPRHKDQNTAS